ncbi:flagellar protein FlgJ [Maridesulfovibrio ferrireducens]|uniref:Flagellar protein FlgJ n=1 Tax=Maridesulfovibrio ferrireducens TaxID=246191 RepID=A0A1G9JGQ6_9BACT|nr:rod-binding protein [Maridesulfovibrio ferrireducens]SDL36376.1 flagellar protein FlgJ [Maridesulfovibrio ferrireducens]
MIITGHDAATAKASAEGQELLGFKNQLNSLNDKISGGKDVEEGLRTACKKFEAVFMGKIWKQMRKGVQKSGYLSNKYEDQYTSMFDKDFSEKLADGGGIGLGDMLYQQLRSKLDNASKATLPGTGNSTGLKTLDEVGRKGSREGDHLKKNENIGANGVPGIPLPKPGIALDDTDFPFAHQVERKLSREMEAINEETESGTEKSAVKDVSFLSRPEAMARIENLARRIEMEHDKKVYGKGVTADEIGRKLAGI